MLKVCSLSLELPIVSSTYIGSFLFILHCWIWVWSHPWVFILGPAWALDRDSDLPPTQVPVHSCGIFPWQVLDPDVFPLYHWVLRSPRDGEGCGLISPLFLGYCLTMHKTSRNQYLAISLPASHARAQLRGCPFTEIPELWQHTGAFWVQTGVCRTCTMVGSTTIYSIHPTIAKMGSKRIANSWCCLHGYSGCESKNHTNKSVLRKPAV